MDGIHVFMVKDMDPLIGWLSSEGIIANPDRSPTTGGECQVNCQYHPECKYWIFSFSEKGLGRGCFLLGSTSSSGEATISNTDPQVVSGPKFCPGKFV